MFNFIIRYSVHSIFRHYSQVSHLTEITMFPGLCQLFLSKYLPWFTEKFKQLPCASDIMKCTEDPHATADIL